MPTHKQQITTYLVLLSFSILPSAFNLAWAESDKQIQERVLKAREMTMQHGEHAEHSTTSNNGPDFRGVYYGYFPCNEADCSGIKITLSLKRNNNYLLVRQPAKPSSREFYEKGKFVWNDDTRSVIITAKGNASTGQYRIVDEGTLIQLNPDGSQLAGDQDDYTLRRADTVKSREVHIH